MPFQLANKFAKGGARPGAGRPKDEFKRWITNLVHSPKVRKRLIKILMDAKDAEEKVNEKGVAIPGRASAGVYLKALELAWHYAEGKPVDRIIMKTIDENNRLQDAIVISPLTNEIMGVLDERSRLEQVSARRDSEGDQHIMDSGPIKIQAPNKTA